MPGDNINISGNGQIWNDTTLPWQNTSLPWKGSQAWNNSSLPWKAGSTAPSGTFPDSATGASEFLIIF